MELLFGVQDLGCFGVQGFQSSVVGISDFGVGGLAQKWEGRTESTEIIVRVIPLLKIYKSLQTRKPITVI